jgi:hypothetical protein
LFSTYTPQSKILIITLTTWRKTRFLPKKNDGDANLGMFDLLPFLYFSDLTRIHSVGPQILSHCRLLLSRFLWIKLTSKLSDWISYRVLVISRDRIMFDHDRDAVQYVSEFDQVQKSHPCAPKGWKSGISLWKGFNSLRSSVVTSGVIVVVIARVITNVIWRCHMTMSVTMSYDLMHVTCHMTMSCRFRLMSISQVDSHTTMLAGVRKNDIQIQFKALIHFLKIH